VPSAPAPVRPAEQQRRSTASGQGSSRSIRAGAHLAEAGVSIASSEFLPEDVVHRVIDLAGEGVLEFLALAVVSQQWNSASLRVLAEVAAAAASSSENDEEKQRDDEGGRWLLTERWAKHFPQWSRLSLRGGIVAGPTRGLGGSVELPEAEDALMYHCCNCRSPILCSRDIVSSNYHGGSGPAFLANRVYNVAMERAAYVATFMTGGYTVRDVCCAGCRITLGKKYCEARDPANRFKIGKFLLEQTLVFLPGCCAPSRGAPARAASRKQHDSGFCTRCAYHFQSRTVQAVLLVTQRLAPGRTRQLWEALSAEKVLLEGKEVTGGGEGERDGGRLRHVAGLAGLAAATPTVVPPQQRRRTALPPVMQLWAAPRAGSPVAGGGGAVSGAGAGAGGAGSSAASERGGGESRGGGGGPPPTSINHHHHGGSSPCSKSSTSSSSSLWAALPWRSRSKQRPASQERSTRPISSPSCTPMEQSVAWRLAMLCQALPPGAVEGRTLAAFVTELSAAVAATSVSLLHHGSAAASAVNPPASRRERDRSASARRERTPPPLDASAIQQHHHHRLAEGIGHGQGHGHTSTPTPEPLPHAVPHAALAPAAADHGADGDASKVPSSDSLTSVRLSRWAILTPAAAEVCRDFQSARSLVSALTLVWQPSWPAERPAAEHLVETLVQRRRLDTEDRRELLKELGLPTSSQSGCSWLSFRL